MLHSMLYIAFEDLLYTCMYNVLYNTCCISSYTPWPYICKYINCCVNYIKLLWYWYICICIIFIKSILCVI